MRPDQMPRQPFPDDQDLERLPAEFNQAMANARKLARTLPRDKRAAFDSLIDGILDLTRQKLSLARENAVLKAKNRGTLANNLCPDHRDKQAGKSCLACTIETLTRQKERAESERDALRKRMSSAPTCNVRLHAGFPVIDVHDVVCHDAKYMERWMRVSLVPLDDAEAKG